MGKKTDIFIFCILISIGLISLRFINIYPQQLLTTINLFINMFESIIISFGLSNFALYLSKIPLLLILLVLSLATVFINSIILLLFKKNIDQAAAMIPKNISTIIVSGLIIYALISFTVVLFTYSIVGVPMAAFILFIAFILMKLGEIPVNIIIGSFVRERLNISKMGSVRYFWLGSFMMFLTKSVYSIGAAFEFFIYPVLSLGTLFVFLVNKFVIKIHYKVEYNLDNDKNKFNKEKMRDIILGNEK